MIKTLPLVTQSPTLYCNHLNQGMLGLLHSSHYDFDTGKSDLRQITGYREKSDLVQLVP